MISHEGFSLDLWVNYPVSGMTQPEALLSLRRAADGRLDAIYDPARITEAAQALLDEVARLQS